jgi:GDP-4-dehydro-6-deoxy-D-mannose reductase
LQVLVTGAGGFVGGHLLTYLKNLPDMFLHGTILNESEKRAVLVAMCERLWILDLRDLAAVKAILQAIQPDYIFHLAGQAFVPRSFEDPWETLETNIQSTLNILQVVSELSIPARVLVVGSADVYGTVKPDQLPLTEDTPFSPTSPYSVSKIAQDMLALQYTLSHRLFTVRMRPFNHIGPGQNIRFAVPNWASQIAEAEAGRRPPFVHVGHLGAARDFTDVRDIVRAYVLAISEGLPGSVYNVCSGEAHTMQTILEKLIGMSKIPIEIRIDTERLRVSDIPVLVGDSQRLREQTGWQPEITLDQTLHDVLTEWRQRVGTQLANTP